MERVGRPKYASPHELYVQHLKGHINVTILKWFIKSCTPPTLSVLERARVDLESSWLIALGLVVRQLRKTKSLTQEQFAHHLGITRNHVQRIEYGQTNLGVATVIRLCTVLEVRPAEFFSQAEAFVASPRMLRAAREAQESERLKGRPRTTAAR